MPVMPSPARKQKKSCVFFQKRAIELQTAVTYRAGAYISGFPATNFVEATEITYHSENSNATNVEPIHHLVTA